MRLSLRASLVLAVALMQPVSVSLSGLLEDMEGSGSDQEGSGSGYGIKLEGPDIICDFDESTLLEENQNSVKQFSDLTLGTKHAPPSGFFVLGDRGSFLENKQILAGAIAGGVTGAVLGAALSAILIYKWRKKQEEECILSKKRHSEDNY